MSEHLTYLASKSHGYVYDDDNGRIISPDENFAREIMQLFTIGLLALDEDGTPKRDESGALIETYTNDDILTFARMWTGFDRWPAKPLAALISGAMGDPMGLRTPCGAGSWRGATRSPPMGSGAGT